MTAARRFPTSSSTSCADTNGLPYAIHVTDREGALEVSTLGSDGLGLAGKILVDSGYTGEAFAANVKTLNRGRGRGRQA
jgi:hypothetical protein